MAIRIHDNKTGKKSGWISEVPTENELKALNIDLLIVYCKNKRIPLKDVLIQQILKKTPKKR